MKSVAIAAVVQQRVALGRRAVARRCACRLASSSIKKLEDLALVLLRRARRKRGRSRGGRGPPARSRSAQLDARRVALARALRRRGRRRSRSDPPWVGSSSTSKTRRPCAANTLRRREEREVREVLVVDRVELVLLDQPQQVRELHRDHAVRLRAGSSSRPRSRSGRAHGRARCSRSAGRRPTRAARVSASVCAEELDDRRNARARSRLRRRWRPARRRAPGSRVAEVLEQVAVVARDLDDLAVAGREQANRSISLRVAAASARASVVEKDEK